jgi:hypothetical protein
MLMGMISSIFSDGAAASGSIAYALMTRLGYNEMAETGFTRMDHGYQ